MPHPIQKTREVPVFENSYGVLFDDEVRSPSGVEGRYLRWRWHRNGIVIVATRGDEVAFTFSYRYPVGDSLLELPRGGLLEDELLERAAARELTEETGLIAHNFRVVGSVYPDSGLIANPIAVVQAEVSGIDEQAVKDAMESISEELVWLEVQNVLSAIRSGRIRCAITIAALAFTSCFRE